MDDLERLEYHKAHGKILDLLPDNPEKAFESISLFVANALLSLDKSIEEFNELTSKNMKMYLNKDKH